MRLLFHLLTLFIQPAAYSDSITEEHEALAAAATAPALDAEQREQVDRILAKLDWLTSDGDKDKDIGTMHNSDDKHYFSVFDVDGDHRKLWSLTEVPVGTVVGVIFTPEIMRINGLLVLHNKLTVLSMI